MPLSDNETQNVEREGIQTGSVRTIVSVYGAATQHREV